MQDFAAQTPLDEVDHRLLGLLQDDASRSNQALAEAARVSPATALRRVRRLVEQGVIERQMAIVSPQAFDAGLTAIVEITLDRQGAEHLAAFEARAVAEPAVQQCYRVTPGPDCVLVVWVRDMSHYNALVQRLFTDDANVRNVKSYFATRRAKFDPRVDFTPPAAQPRAQPTPSSAAPAP
ncbi:MAG: Lrp/AsnC family transcriptional regulator [Burkholderiaceae bacterium]|nr:MAG: Lrp/AsnC family transcriptional regulator [Burkholderiaceae bacterium]MCC7287690.1 Lrp/AsnC family transcriptional regulator [Burkholderiaceae bacterium]